MVKTKIGPSKIAGIGLFADQFIPKGTIVWKFQPGFDLKIDKNEISKLSEPAKKNFLNYAYFNSEGKYILCFDDARFFNHSENPSCLDPEPVSGEDGITIASRDIQIGEEITSDYREFDSDFEYKMGIEKDS